MQKLLDAVRKACLPGLWSQGVKLAREGAVFGAEARGDSMVARVRVSGQAVAPTVTLYPGDAEWSCDCEGKVDPCAHVAAAAIALAQGAATGQASAPATARGRLRYKLRRRAGALSLERWIVRPNGDEEPLRTSLAGPGARAVDVEPTHEDLTLDRIVGSRQFGWFPPDRTADVFDALSGAANVLLDDVPIRTSREAIPPRGTLVDHGADGVCLVIDRDPRVTGVVVGGVVRSGDVLHPMRETDLSGPTLDRLPMRRAFARADLGALVTKVLPDLEKRIPIDVQTRRLPTGKSRARPRIHLDLRQEGSALSVTPSLVYGDPPEARVEGDRLVHLQGAVPVRDEPAERELVAKLRDELNLVTGRSVAFEGADAIRFAARLLEWSRASRDVVARGDLFGGGELVPRFDIQDSLFDVVFELRTEQDDGAPPRRAEAGAVIQAWQEGLPLVPLLGGGFAPLPHDWLERYGARVADLLAARRDDGEIPLAALPALGELCEELECPRPAALDELAPLFAGFESIPAAKLPVDLDATLRPYQQRGVDWLCFLRDARLGAVLADDMGLGKTLQALAAVRGRTLIVCPRSVVHNWAAEIQRFRPALRHAIYHGPKRALDPSASITLTTYAILRLDAEALAREAWDTIILDEAQAIKNPDSQVSRAAYALKGAARVALSGTPVENRLEELWSLLHFTNPGLLGGRSGFRERYEVPIGNGNGDVAARLRKAIRPFVLRRLKREVAPELPPRTEAVLYCELEDEERRVYEAVRAAARKEVVERLAEGGSVLAALEALLRLRQAACHPALVPGQAAESSSKVERLVEALEDAAADGHKALVFSQWTSLLDLLEPHLRKAGVDFVRLDGSTRDRAGVVGSFQDPGGPPVMLISLKAGGTGLNLTAADHVFLMDPWWNPAVEDQAADRAHRIGQDRPVMVYRLVAKDTVEEGILALQQRKRVIAEAALGEAGEAASITREDLLALLNS